MKTLVINKKMKGQKGFSLPELVVVLLILAILVVLALPQVISSRRAFRFSGMQRQIAAALNEARQEAMAQRKAVTFLYDDADKKIIIHGGKFGAFGDAKNRTAELSGSGLEAGNIIYGRPGGAATSPLADTANLTPIASGTAAITFYPDGSVLDAANNPQNNALFFYNNIYQRDMAFAISVLGAGGRVKIWRYNKAINLYVE
jgi:prepilin-type N-terminal cleavage/methylation domain-containing protein